jgi:hypothetical protein
MRHLEESSITVSSHVVPGLHYKPVHRAVIAHFSLRLQRPRQ